MTIMSFGALAGPPISGAINTSTGGYKDVGIYAGMSKCRVAYNAYNVCNPLSSSCRVRSDACYRLHAVHSVDRA